ncbi:MAG: AMP-binding protein [Bacteroidales bacterium]|nr:AMP-binding protein [Bacteroidales bacterium]
MDFDRLKEEYARFQAQHEAVVKLNGKIKVELRLKILTLQKKYMIWSAENTCRYFRLDPGQTALLCLPVDYIAGKMMVVRCFVGGLNLYMTEPRSTPDLTGMTGIDFCAMVPVQVTNSFSNKMSYPSIQKLIVGGTGITAELENLVRDIPVQVFATYGMAETCSHIAVRRMNGPHPEPFYQALPGIELNTDERNCLVIKTSSLPAPLITNDQVQMTGENRFRWIGRIDNLINIRGRKVVPEEVESAVLEKTGLECALIGLPDQKHGQRLVFIAEGKTGVKESLIISELKKLLPPKLQPGKIVWIEKLPRNKAFKLDRPKLVDMVYKML